MMWEQQESQERVSTVYTTHVQSNLRELKHLCEETQKKEKVWQELLAKKAETLSKVFFFVLFPLMKFSSLNHSSAPTKASPKFSHQRL